MKKVWVMINKTLLKIIVLFPLFFILSCSNNSNDQVMEKVGAQIDSGFELPNLDGQEVNISNYKGKYILINFWATWCKPCVRELPSLENLQSNFNAANFEIIAIHIGQTKDQVRSFLTEQGISLNVLIDEDITLSNWMVEAIPTTFLVNKEGIVEYRYVGEKDWGSESVISFIQSKIN